MNNFQEIEPLRASETTMMLIRKIIWERTPNRSIISGLWLRSYVKTPLFPNCFINVLPVREYPMFKYYTKGIVLVTPGEAGLWMQGTTEERIQYALDFEEQSKGKSTANWNILAQLELELLTEYRKYFPITYKGIVNYHYSLAEIEAIVGHLNKEFWDSFK